MVNIKKKVGLSLAALLMCSTAHAEVLSLMNGRSANLKNFSEITAEAGAAFGDDYTYFGARINYAVAPNIALFGDLGRADFDGPEGTSFGGGVFYQVEGLFDNTHTAVKGSYHTVEAEDGRFEVDFSALVFQFIASGDQIGETKLGWYANIGAHILDSDFNDETEIGFGGGITSKVSFGELFLGLNIIDDPVFGGGARYSF